MLDKRLSCVAGMIRPGSRLADIGTDHAYLPAALVENGHCPRAIACDIRPGPADSARRTVQAAGLADRIEIRLGDGLAPIQADEVDDIVIAGMGGETIAAILTEGLRRWLPEERDTLSGMQFILQPMSRPEELRRMLMTSGFSLLEEVTVENGGHLYTVIRARFTDAPPCTEEARYYIGALTLPEGAAFLQKQRQRLIRRAEGLRTSGAADETLHRLDAIILEMDRYLQTEERGTSL